MVHESIFDSTIRCRLIQGLISILLALCKVELQQFGHIENKCWSVSRPDQYTIAPLDADCFEVSFQYF